MFCHKAMLKRFLTKFQKLNQDVEKCLKNGYMVQIILIQNKSKYN